MSFWLTIALGVALAALVAWLLARWLPRHLQKRRAAALAARPSRTVVLAHGVLGFDELWFGERHVEYFNGIPDTLRELDAVVHAPRLPMLGGVLARAQQLAAYVTALPARRVVIIAHSLGGLDARYAIAKLGLHERVAALVTVSTPHHGTPIADGGARILDTLGIGRLLKRLGVDAAAIQDLSQAQLKEFNQVILDASEVTYFSVVGALGEDRSAIHPLLLPTYLFLRERSGANDGMVPSWSQRWGKVLFEVDADHWAQVGWSKHFNARALYRDILEALRARGF